MYLPRELFIADVEHASYVRVDEAGTTAAAATSVEMARLGISLSPRRPPVFVVDHSFIFAIRDERTGALLFIGVLNRV
jgi:serpin B